MDKLSWVQKKIHFLALVWGEEEEWRDFFYNVLQKIDVNPTKEKQKSLFNLCVRVYVIDTKLSLLLPFIYYFFIPKKTIKLSHSAGTWECFEAAQSDLQESFKTIL